MTTRVYIGLGSNQESPQNQLQQALKTLKDHKHIHALKVSWFYRSAPVGPVAQPDFINAVAQFETDLQPLHLLDLLQSIEANHGRERLVHWGPRTLDLDILLYGNANINSERLNVPHSQMHLRAFVLIPLKDLAPELVINHQSIDQLIAALPEKDIKGISRITLKH